MPTLTFTAIALVLFTNRVTELVKKALTASPRFKDTTDDEWALLIFLLSLVIGILALLFVFPSANLFTGLGASTTAELVASGVVIAGLSNGVDFLAGNLDGILQTNTTTDTSKLTVETKETTTTPPAADAPAS